MKLLRERASNRTGASVMTAAVVFLILLVPSGGNAAVSQTQTKLTFSSATRESYCAPTGPDRAALMCNAGAAASTGGNMTVNVAIDSGNDGSRAVNASADGIGKGSLVAKHSLATTTKKVTHRLRADIGSLVERDDEFGNTWGWILLTMSTTFESCTFVSGYWYPCGASTSMFITPEEAADGVAELVLTAEEDAEGRINLGGPVRVEVALEATGHFRRQEVTVDPPGVGPFLCNRPFEGCRIPHTDLIGPVVQLGLPTRGKVYRAASVTASVTAVQA